MGKLRMRKSKGLHIKNGAGGMMKGPHAASAFSKRKANKGHISKRCFTLLVFCFVCIHSDIQLPQPH